MARSEDRRRQHPSMPANARGHYGWSLDLPHQQRLRDVMGLEIGDGTAQIMKLIIAREMLKLRAR
ncbi:MAG: acyl-CoA dehydrogenase family protein [Xanthobacteraceae bacterium]